jgi:hypothetical protein
VARVTSFGGFLLGVDKFLHLVVKILALVESDRSLPGRSTLVYPLQKLTNWPRTANSSLSFYAIHDTLESGLNNIQVGEFDAEEPQRP